MTQGYVGNACANPARQQRLIGGFKPAIPKRAIECCAMHRKCPCQSAYGYAEFLRDAVAAKQRLERDAENNKPCLTAVKAMIRAVSEDDFKKFSDQVFDNC